MARGPGGEFDAQRFAQRMADESAQRDEMITAAIEMMTLRLDSLQKDVRQGNLNHFDLQRRLADLEMQVAETRESVRLQGPMEAEAAAKGAASGAASGAVSAQVVPAIKDALAKSAGRPSKPAIIAFAIVIMMGMSDFVEKAPKVFRAINAFFIGVMGLDRQPPM